MNIYKDSPAPCTKTIVTRKLTYLILLFLFFSCGNNGIDENVYFDTKGNRISERSFKNKGGNGKIKRKSIGINGKILVYEFELKNNKMNGKWIQKNEHGKIEQEGYYKNDLKEGPEIWWHKNGIKMLEMYFKNGKLEGKKIGYFDSGEISDEWNYRNGHLHGKLIFYETNGKVLLEEVYEDGKLVKKIK